MEDCDGERTWEKERAIHKPKQSSGDPEPACLQSTRDKGPRLCSASQAPAAARALALERLASRQACHDGSYLPGTAVPWQEAPARSARPSSSGLPRLRREPRLHGPPPSRAAGPQATEGCISLRLQCWAAAGLVGT